MAKLKNKLMQILMIINWNKNVISISYEQWQRRKTIMVNIFDLYRV